MYDVDLHAHTRFFHGRRSLGDRFDPWGCRALTGAARRRGLDAVATTNHDYYTPLTGVDGVAVIPGIEITTSHGHLLVVGPDPPTESVPGELTPAAAVERAHDRGCAAILAHPFRKSRLAECTDVPYDAVEVNGKHPRTRAHVEEIARAFDLPLVGGSDAHFPFEVGSASTRIDADELTPESIVPAIRDGRVEPRVRASRVDRTMRRFYTRVHRYKHGRDPLKEAIQ